MPTTKRYRIVVQWQHRKWGPQTEKLSAEGSSIRRALSSALLGFFSDSTNRDRRRDAHKQLRCEIWRTGPASSSANAATPKRSTGTKRSARNAPA